MHVAKPALFGLLACCLVWAWFNRSLVLDAYDDPSSPVALQLDGIDLTVDTTPLPPSPFTRVTARDTSRIPPALAYIDPEPAAPVEMAGGESSVSGTVFGAGLRPRPDSPFSSPSSSTTAPPTTAPPVTAPTGTSTSPFSPIPPIPETSTTAVPSPLQRAVVRLERHTTQGTGVLELPVDGQGRWRADNLPGGRYRLRAWIPGLATLVQPVVFFLEDGDVTTHRLELVGVDPSPRLELADGGPMYVGLDAQVGVVASRRWIDEDGFVVTGPMTGASISLTVTGPLDIESAATATTDGRGLARFNVRCRQPGDTSGTAVMGGLAVSGPFPTCQPVPVTAQPAGDDSPAGDSPPAQPATEGGQSGSGPASNPTGRTGNG